MRYQEQKIRNCDPWERRPWSRLDPCNSTCSEIMAPIVEEPPTVMSTDITIDPQLWDKLSWSHSPHLLSWEILPESQRRPIRVWGIEGCFVGYDWVQGLVESYAFAMQWLLSSGRVGGEHVYAVSHDVHELFSVVHVSVVHTLVSACLAQAVWEEVDSTPQDLSRQLFWNEWPRILWCGKSWWSPASLWRCACGSFSLWTICAHCSLSAG